MPATFTIPSIFTAIDKFSAPVRGMGMAMNSFALRSETAMARAERGFRALMSPLAGLRNMMNNLGYYVGIYTFIRVMRDAYNTVADFEQAQVDIAAVTGRTMRQNKGLADQSRVLALRYGEATKSVLALDLSLIKLGNDQAQVLKMSEAVSTAAVALKGAPDEVAKKIGAILQAFKIPAEATNQVADLLAKAADLSALDWSDLSTMLPTAMQSAAIAWKNEAPIDQLKRLLALFATVRNAQVHVASGATGIKNLLVDASITGKTYQELLQKIIESPNQIRKAYKLLGRRTLVSALPISEAQKMGSIEDFIDKLNTQAPGYAMRVATQRLNSMRGSVKLLGTAYDEFLLSLEDGSGKIAKTFRGIVETTRVMLLLAAGTDQAKVITDQMPSSIIENARQWMNLFSVMWSLIKAIIVFKAVLLAMRFVLFSITAMQWLWNAAVTVSVFLSKRNILGLLATARSMVVYNVVTRQAAIGQTLLNFAMYASPLILFAVGILAVVGVMKLMNSWVDSLVGGLNDYTSSLGSAIDQHQKFSMEAKSPFADPNSPFRMVDPTAAYKFDMMQKQSAMDKMRANEESFFSDKFKAGYYEAKEKVSTRPSESEGFRASQMNGTVKVVIDDKGNYVKEVESDNPNIMPKITGNQVDWIKRAKENY